MKYLLSLSALLLCFCLQGQNQIYLSEDFENGLGAFSNDSGNTVDWTISTNYNHTGSQSAANRYGQSQLNVLTQTTSIDLSGASHPVFEFYQIAKTTNFSDRSSVQISIDGGTTYFNLPSSAYRGSASNYDTRGYFDEESYAIWEKEPATPDDNSWWKREVFDLSNYAVANVKIRFRLSSTTAIPRTGWFVDDVKIYEPDCVSPDDQMASNLTDNSVELDWNERGTATEWDIEYGATGFRQGNGIPVLRGVGKPYQLTNLSPQTSYDFYVRSACGPTENSEWVGPFKFETDCVAVSSFGEDFESVILPALPGCWSKLVGTGSSALPEIETSRRLISSSITNAVELYNGNNLTDPVILVSPLLSSLSDGTHRLSFQASNSTSSQDLIVGTLSNRSDASTFTPFATVDINFSSDEYQVDFSTYTGTDRYIGFSRVNTQSFSRVFLDDIRWESTACLAPHNLSATRITSTSAQIDWNQTGTAVAWDIEYGPTGFARGSGMMVQDVSSNSYVISNLSSSTEYDVYIKADCGMGEESIWTNPLTFKTACGSIDLPYLETFTTDPDCWQGAQGELSINTVFTDTSSEWTFGNFGNTGSNNAAYLNIYSDDFYEWYISPSFVLNGNQQLSFDIALTEYFGTGPADTFSGFDDLFAVVISLDDGVT